jgi:hypothetical protein
MEVMLGAMVWCLYPLHKIYQKVLLTLNAYTGKRFEKCKLDLFGVTNIHTCAHKRHNILNFATKLTVATQSLAVRIPTKIFRFFFESMQLCILLL